MTTKSNKFLSLALMAIFTLLLLAFFIFEFNSRNTSFVTTSRHFISTSESSKKTGILIAAKIDQFHLDHGRYPDRLADLVPEYLVDIPEPEEGEVYFYRLKENEYDLRFGLWFVKDVDLYPKCTYYSKTKSWQNDF